MLEEQQSTRASSYSTRPSYPPVIALLAEHDEILKVLGAFETWEAGVHATRKEERFGLRQFLQFFMDFADGYHHVKEERVLFPAMRRFGFAQEPGPVDIMTSEHEQGRQMIGRLSILASQSEPWSPRCFTEIHSLVQSYVVLLRHHIDKESKVLYPMVEANLPPAAWEHIAQRFDAIDEERECAGQVQETQDLVAALLRAAEVLPLSTNRD